MAGSQTSPDYDILIAGAGAVGASLACALAGSGYRVAVIEAIALPDENDAAAASPHDGRGLALSLASQQVLERIGVWPSLASSSNPIRHIHVSHRGHFGSVRLDAELLGSDALGYVVPAARLGRALLETLGSAANIDFICPARLTTISQDSGAVTALVEYEDRVQQLHARLLVGADGSQSRVRELCDIDTRVKDYDQTAIVSSVRSELPHDDTAWERFTDSGPFALLPLADGRCVSVCCVSGAAAESMLAKSDADFLVELEQRFGRRLGRLREPGPRQSYPIRLVESERQRADRVLLLGNSVHTVHPNAAQGFNLGLHDAAALADCLLEDAVDPGSEIILRRYLGLRRPVQKRVVRFTDALAWLFYEPHSVLGPVIAPGRSLAMLAMDMLPPVKKFFARRTAGLNQ